MLTAEVDNMGDSITQMMYAIIEEVFLNDIHSRCVSSHIHQCMEVVGDGG